jgi:hypothetical protein
MEKTEIERDGAVSVSALCLALTCLALPGKRQEGISRGCAGAVRAVRENGLVPGEPAGKSYPTRLVSSY